MRNFDKFIDGVEEGNLELVKLNFIGEYLDRIIKLSEDNSRAIHIGSRNGNIEIVQFLLNEGADKEVETKNGKRPIHFAAIEGHNKIVQLLIAHSCDIESETSNGERPIHYAAMKGHADVLKTLIDNNCRLEPKDRDGNTPLLLATMCDNEECIKLLENAIEFRKSNAMPNITKKEMMLPLKELIEQNYMSTVLDPENGKTLLDLVIESNDQILLDLVRAKHVSKEEYTDFVNIKGKGISAQSYDLLEECILHRFLRTGSCCKPFEHLIPEVVNRPSLIMGPTALELTVEYNWHMFRKLVLHHLLKVDESWNRAIDIGKRNGFHEAARNVSQRRDYLSRRESIGFSRLHVAVFDDCPMMVEYILKNQLLPIDIGDKLAGTSLSLSYALDNSECMDILQMYGASADTRGKFNQTPLHIAIAGGSYDFSDYLVDRMTKLEVKDALGFTVLDRARKCGYQDLCDKLIAKGAKYNDDPRISDNEPYRLPLF